MQDMRTQRVLLVGAGNIGRILLARLPTIGIPNNQIVVCDVDSSRAQALAEPAGSLWIPSPTRAHGTRMSSLSPCRRR